MVRNGYVYILGCICRSVYVFRLLKWTVLGSVMFSLKAVVSELCAGAE